MIIESIAASLPEWRVTNEDIVEMIREHSTGHFEGDLDKHLRLVLNLLKRTGLKERRWCGQDDAPINHITKAVDAALNNSSLQPNDVELLLYVGVGRGFIEPGNSHVIASTLGLNNAQCFDVVDACMSWIRALQLVDSLFKSGGYNNALVINAEFNIKSTASFRLKNPEQTAYTFPTFTIGEAATATILTPQNPENFEFHFSSRPDLADLCTIPLEGYETFCHPTERMGKNDIMGFTSYGQDLHNEAFPEAVKVFKQISKDKPIDSIFVHASSKKEWNRFGQALGVQDKIHHIYPHTGNLVSASIPTAIHMSIQEKTISRGDNIVLWVGSAGMSFNATHFKY